MEGLVPGGMGREVICTRELRADGDKRIAGFPQAVGSFGW